MTLRSIRSWLRSITGNVNGMGAVEFALASPVLILMFFGSFQMSEAIAAKRKVTITTKTLTDLTTQSTSLTTTDADTLLAAAQQVMAPYPSANGAYRVSEVSIDALGVAKVVWSRSLNGTALAANTVVVLPTGTAPPNTYIIMGDVNYGYAPAVTTSLIGTINMSDIIYMAPRKSDSIPLT